VSHTFDEASSDWIGSIHKHDRDRTSGPLQRRYQLTAYGNDDVRRERDQFRRVAINTVRFTVAGATSFRGDFVIGFRVR
jgi:hypothetical protein